MTPRAFFLLVSDMRQAERENEQSRSPATYSRMKNLQARVDAEIERVNAIIEKQKPEQQNLFN